MVFIEVFTLRGCCAEQWNILHHCFSRFHLAQAVCKVTGRCHRGAGEAASRCARATFVTIQDTATSLNW